MARIRKLKWKMENGKWKMEKDWPRKNAESAKRKPADELFVAEGLDWIETRGFPGGVVAEDDSDGGGDGDGGDDGG